MNNILELKGKRFGQTDRQVLGFGISMKSNQIVTKDKILTLKHNLENINKQWLNETKYFNGILITVFYNTIISKTNRINGLFKGNKSNDCIVGAKFNNDKDKHIITYYLDTEDIDKSIVNLNNVSKVLDDNYKNGIVKTDFSNVLIEKIDYKKYSLSKTLFKKIIADASYIEEFSINKPEKPKDNSIITIYKTEVKTDELLKKIGINVVGTKIFDELTVNLDKSQIDTLYENAPYLIAMSTIDMAALSPDDIKSNEQTYKRNIKSPTIEPTIGVIDTLFDNRVYFSEWVEYKDLISDEIQKTEEDYKHGTSVDSIIVDGPSLNPWLDDGCGNFKVRHFGVSLNKGFSSFTIINQIKKIIRENTDIKVWNISLGSEKEVSDNFISAEAAVLDQIQYEYDVIFVIAGTNLVSGYHFQRIGSPADSINSVVVNSVDENNISSSYSRNGIVLGFFTKPDVSYYGGSDKRPIIACGPFSTYNVMGTSYAAPWIARKLSYLIDVLGFNRQVAKALLIDSAKGWNTNNSLDKLAQYGYGIVPIKINDILHTKNDEIKFLVSDISEKWNTYNYEFPVPISKDKYPYIARAVMCYFPKCNKNQGVDYTNTELNIKFGRLLGDKKIDDIKGDKRNNDIDEEVAYIFESDARRKYRKWDNVKCISEDDNSKKRNKDIKYNNNKNWGMEIKTNNRLNKDDGKNIRFGVVVTIKAIDGVNRIDEFVQACSFNGWTVREINVQNRIEINKLVKEDIKFE